MRSHRAPFMVTILACALTSAAAFSLSGSLAPFRVGLPQRTVRPPAGACSMGVSSRADLPPNVVELLSKASERVYEPVVAEAKEEWGGQRLPLPGFDLASFGFAGRWQEVGGSFVLEPPKGVLTRGIVHFLGGAFIGAAPHIGYRHLPRLPARRAELMCTSRTSLVEPATLESYVEFSEFVAGRLGRGGRGGHDSAPPLPPGTNQGLPNVRKMILQGLLRFDGNGIFTPRAHEQGDAHTQLLGGVHPRYGAASVLTQGSPWECEPERPWRTCSTPTPAPESHPDEYPS